jgi:hypothetical protein
MPLAQMASHSEADEAPEKIKYIRGRIRPGQKQSGRVHNDKLEVYGSRQLAGHDGKLLTRVKGREGHSSGKREHGRKIAELLNIFRIRLKLKIDGAESVPKVKVSRVALIS